MSMNVAGNVSLELIPAAEELYGYQSPISICHHPKSQSHSCSVIWSFSLTNSTNIYMRQVALRVQFG